MREITINTSCKRMLADVYTPVGVYLRLRDRFRDTVLLESTDSHAAENSYSFIAVNAVAGMEIRNEQELEYKFPGEKPEKRNLGADEKPEDMLWDFLKHFKTAADQNNKEISFAQGFYGYTSYDAIPFFEAIKFKERPASAIPLLRYRLYQYVIVFNHFRDELFICENHIEGLQSELPLIESVIRNKDVPEFPFQISGKEKSNITDEAYLEMVRRGIEHCYRGDVFQVVLSRMYEQRFTGDEFNVYRALRSINPSPYLFFFDYGDYKLMGSSPEAQLVVKEAAAVMHPIAGTFKRTGHDETDKISAEKLLADPKENAEHVMLVDLARNDLSRMCSQVQVSEFRKVQFFSHVIHLVSEVKGVIDKDANPFALLATTFPAGTLSGAPKYRAMQLIDRYEPDARGYYGGSIGFVGLDGTLNHAIMIRSFLCKNNTLTYRAGAGVVAVSDPVSELNEVNNKLNALKKAIDMAQQIHQ
ncbi:MAG: anthranilate synthase component I family protein [Ferruginibacter sp.]